MMKKILYISLVFALVFLLYSCGNNTNNKTPIDSTSLITSNNDVTETAKPTENTTNVAETTDIPETTSIPETTAPETEPPIETQVGYVGVTGLTLDKYAVSVPVGTSDMPWVTMTPWNATNKAELWSSSDNSIATVDAIGNITGISVGNCVVTVRSADNKNVYANVSVTVTAPPELTYFDGILIANKSYPLPNTYNPGNNQHAVNELYKMFAAAKQEGINLFVKSGFRSYYDQRWIYNDYVARDGKANADRYSARPGHSEHQTGLAFDLNNLHQSFGQTPEGIWLANNCYKFGFIIRYPQDKETITGYMYEPWHVRYIGIEKATAVYQSGLCLEEYLGIDSVYANP